jgi:hypothetical protein
MDTSDAVYEKRHRRYEAHEKRQRLREREQLQYEQYKLKERIMELKTLDDGAFLALPADIFSPPPASFSSTDGESSSANGDHAHFEADRRRRELLQSAYTLEERFRILLPPTHRPRPNATASTGPTRDPSSQRHTSPEHSSRLTSSDEGGDSDAESNSNEEDSDATETDIPGHQTSEKLKIKLPKNARVAVKAKTGKGKKTSSTPIPESNARVKVIPKRKSGLLQGPRSSTSFASEEPPTNRQRTANGASVSAPVPSRRRGRPPRSPPLCPPSPVVSDPETPGLEFGSLSVQSDPLEDDESLRPHKRARVAHSPGRSVSSTPLESVSTRASRRLRDDSRDPSPRLERPDVTPPGVLRVEAQRSLGAVGSRQSGIRHIRAFAMAVPESITSEYHYELPGNILEDKVFRERKAKYGDIKEDYSPLEDRTKKSGHRAGRAAARAGTSNTSTPS